MKVILKQDHEKLGKAGDVVEVKPGYARNYLLPRGIALAATPSNLKAYHEQKKLDAQRLERAKKGALALAEKLNGVSCTATVAVGEEDRVFGSVTSQTIADLLKEKGFDIDKKKILLEEPIKALGIYDVAIKLHPEIEAKVKVWVVKA
ncbi:MAG: 50S ribosomal protein L9 [candidate division KSB1 bacterium]|nr:50S ribosomal protein L9 [candidate division KSB1 bacterium]MDZ7294710.1 50S ribosomal protein L9 [candidate division KSB1 bacterium]MDZ7337981.1 50S ribosomal protein L9 [candidate division KSB1 bacterium]MDZ7380170.1 50S ribosomal protein L9 [candidate division KSB1 bacterium]MDZ7384984.1 50S ribosomal protein L9 [candidate division KSB1 bacterium]